MQHDWVVFWVVMRSGRKLVRYFHRIYLEMGFRHELFILEWLCITSLTYTFPVEYLTGVVIILVTFPVVRTARTLQLAFGSLFSLDLSFCYLVLLFASLPYFLSTLVYVCRKRTSQIEVKRTVMRKRRSAMSHEHSSSEESN